jgi:L-seryl-tRNA(Ser) seleniumtransferase
MSDLRLLPSVELLLQTHSAAELIGKYGRPLTLEAIRFTLADIRSQHRDGDTLPKVDMILEIVASHLRDWLAPGLISVINATGVILHTNLGRAPLSRAALQAVQVTCGGYSNLEFDLNNGSRGNRGDQVEKSLCRLTGAEAALVVNNNAAAVMLALAALANRRQVVISRTQLVEIGGGFRVPDVMRQSGARLLEIGTTNRVHISDYELALAEPTVLVMRAHPSNFRIIGFTSEPELVEIVKVAHAHNLPVLDDLGSGALLDTDRFGLVHEPTVQESIRAGADVVCFSGDKLLGGPQAGILVGKKDLLQKIKKHPLARAVRADKMSLAALSATLGHYLKDEAEREIPTWRMISLTAEETRARATRWMEVLKQGTIEAGLSTVGGGSLPEETLPTFTLQLDVSQPNRFLGKLRKANPPIIARIDGERVLLDPRTVLPEQEGALLVGLQNALR